MATFRWSELRQRVKDRLELKRFWDDDEIRDAFNEGMYLFNLATGTWRTRITLPTIANQSLYVLPASMVYRMRMTYNDLPISPSNREDLNNARYQWRSDTSATGAPVPTRPMLWIPIDLYLFYLWPADAVGGATLTVDGVSATPVVVEEGDTVDIEEEHLTALLGFSLHQLTFKKGGPAFQATMPYLQAFLQECVDINEQIKSSQAFRRLMGLDDRGFKPFRAPAEKLSTLVGGGS